MSALPDSPSASPPPRHDELASLIERHTPADGSTATALPGLNFYRSSSPTELNVSFYRPSLALLAQGAKRVQLGDDVYEYDTSHYLLTSFDLPVASRVTLATPGTPYLCFALDLDPHRIAGLISELGAPPAGQPLRRGLTLARLTEPLLDAVLRLARLLDTPADIPVLAPLIEREIHYRLLSGPMGGRLRHIARAEGTALQIARAIDWLRRHYAQPLRVEHLATTVNMSVSSLHHHFKAVTALSPLQYQKQLRLHEAHRLMVAETLDAGAAAHRVGYESASQFSREYSRLCGAPPLRDAARLRGTAPADAQSPGLARASASATV
ncbi:AraC family transcriptional regulator, partial [Bordetella pertussis]